MRVFDLFCGIGGLSYGFYQDSDFEIVGANEIDEDIAKGYLLNHPNTKMFNCNIKDLTEEQLRELGTIDIIIGGPPCQSYSMAGKRRLDDKAYLFLEYKRILSILKPKLFIFENVTGLISMDDYKLFPKILEEFKELGYNVKYQILNSADYGVPQARKRIFLIGQLGEINNFEYPIPTHVNRHISIGEALSDLPSIPPGGTDDHYAKEPDNDFLRFVRDTNSLTEYKSPNSKEKMIQIMNYLKEGESAKELPPELRPKCFDSSYGKMYWDRPSGTITTNFRAPNSGAFIHPRDSRALSIREGARLQSFPDSYQFYGSLTKKSTEIGNAVPPLLSIVLAKQVKKIFEVD